MLALALGSGLLSLASGLNIILSTVLVAGVIIAAMITLFVKANKSQAEAAPEAPKDS